MEGDDIKPSFSIHHLHPGSGVGLHQEAQACGRHQVRPQLYPRGPHFDSVMERRLYQGHDPTAAAVNPELGDRGLQAFPRPLPTEERLLSHLHLHNRGAHELGRLLVRGNALLPWSRWACWAVQIRRQERRVRGYTRGGEAGAGAGPRELIGDSSQPVPCGGPGGPTPVRRDRACHGLKGHGLQGGLIRDADMYGCLTRGVQCGSRIPMRDGCVLAPKAEGPRG
ncbi:hypothetical protein SAY86_001888 [Trapa natans]|uniref:Uncharacterized protein n=1 Tax=Trapa natans TaxID=22666 RepID=A0AAN7LI99_TRANT|nr:hypothetical protein SAY86_001888 [Trapa natans]